MHVWKNTQLAPEIDRGVWPWAVKPGFVSRLAAQPSGSFEFLCSLPAGSTAESVHSAAHPDPDTHTQQVRDHIWVRRLMAQKWKFDSGCQYFFFMSSVWRCFGGARSFTPITRSLLMRSPNSLSDWGTSLSAFNLSADEELHTNNQRIYTNTSHNLTTVCREQFTHAHTHSTQKISPDFHSK